MQKTTLCVFRKKGNLFHEGVAIAPPQLRHCIDADKRIKGIQIGDYEIKLVNFADDMTIFLRDITCFNKIQVILKLFEEASSSKANVSKN